MKITKSQLKQIIKEEIQATLSEQSPRDRMRRSMDDFGDEFDAPAKPARRTDTEKKPAESPPARRTDTEKKPAGHNTGQQQPPPKGPDEFREQVLAAMKLVAALGPRPKTKGRAGMEERAAHAAAKKTIMINHNIARASKTADGQPTWVSTNGVIIVKP
jgi:hypothetical protein